jgi:hypothetical protein
MRYNGTTWDLSELKNQVYSCLWVLIHDRFKGLFPSEARQGRMLYNQSQKDFLLVLRKLPGNNWPMELASQNPKFKSGL